MLKSPIARPAPQQPACRNERHPHPTLPAEDATTDLPAPQLGISLGPVSLPNPLLVASGTFGYGREMEHLIDINRLGGIIPKTVTATPRDGNPPWRTIETSGGMLNSIGLDNDGIDTFLNEHVPYLTSLDVPIVVSVAGRTEEEFVTLASASMALPGSRQSN